MKHLPRPAVAGLIVALGLVAVVTGWSRPSGQDETAYAATTDTVTLAPICNNVALTWGAGTDVAMVAAAVQPAAALESIWRQAIVNDMQTFIAWSPIMGAPNDYTATQSPLDAVFVCMRQAGTLTRPDR